MKKKAKTVTPARARTRRPESRRSAAADPLALFARRVGNELNNPLAAVLAAHQYLRRRIEMEGAFVNDPRVRSFLDIIDAELAATSRVVGDLLAFGAQRPVMRSFFLMREAVDEGLALVRKPPNVRCENHVSDDTAPVNLDREMFVRVVAQLGQNGVDAIEDGKAGLVVVEGSASAKRVSLTVRDDGRGMSPDVAKKMRVPLFSTKPKGIGLGASIADALVTQHGGELGCKSTGSGTTVKITLPNG